MPRVNRLGTIAGSLLAALLTTLLATQIAVADAPDSSGVASHFYDIAAFAYNDEADGLTALGGPPPEEGCFGEGFDDLALFLVVEEPSGALKVHIRQGPTPVSVYDLTLDQICETIIGGGAVQPLYVGWMSTVLNDNDAEVSLTRTNSFGGSSHGMVWDGVGNQCAFSAHDRLQVTRDEEFRVLSSEINISC